MSLAAAWDKRRARISTRKGGWRIGAGITVHGHSLLEELVGTRSFTEVLFLEVCGKLPDPALARWIEASFLCLSFPDPRIWCNQIGALAGSARVDPVTGIAAGVMASDSTLYGPGTTRAACAFLLAAKAAAAAGEAPRDFLARHTTRSGRLRAPGFARPIARGDDRVDALARLSARLGFVDGVHLALAWQLDDAAQAATGDRINMLGYLAAFLLDRGIAIEDGERLYALCVNAGVHACYAEAASEPPGAFLPLAVADVEYLGPAPRALPAAGTGA